MRTSRKHQPRSLDQCQCKLSRQFVHAFTYHAGIRIKKLRTHYGVSAIALATRFGVADSTYSYWERGSTPMPSRIVCKVAQIFNVTTDYLLLGTLPDGKATEAEVFLYLPERLAPEWESLKDKRFSHS